MPRIAIASYNNASTSARALKEALGGRILRRQNSRYQYRQDDLVLNWGCSTDTIPEVVTRTVHYSRLLNNPILVDRAIDKLYTYQMLQENGVQTLVFTTDRNEARVWLQTPRDTTDGGSPILHEVVARTSTRASGGRGISIIDQSNSSEIDATGYRFYTQYIPKRAEYRVHVFQGQVIDITQKVLRKHDENGVPVDPNEIDWKIRSYTNGFIFQRNNIKVPEQVTTQAVAAIAALGLDFGGVDVGWNEKRQLAFVIEINTAPGLEGTTLDNYVKAIKSANTNYTNEETQINITSPRRSQRTQTTATSAASIRTQQEVASYLRFIDDEYPS